MLKPVVRYGCETQFMIEKTKDLRQLYNCPDLVPGIKRRKSKHVIRRIKQGWLRKLMKVIQMAEEKRECLDLWNL
jgi:hypothetical protein